MWSVFDPRTGQFARLEIPTRPGESFVSAYGIVARGDFYITVHDAHPPRNAVILRSRPLRGEQPTPRL